VIFDVVHCFKDRSFGTGSAGAVASALLWPTLLGWAVGGVFEGKIAIGLNRPNPHLLWAETETVLKP
jgi:hypothetical protein